MTKPILAILVLALSASAQTIDLKSSNCQGTPTKPKLSAFLPATVTIAGATKTVSVPVCLSLGAGLQINANSELEAIPAPPPATTTVKMWTETVPLASTIPASQLTLDVTLQKTPAPNTMVLAFLQSSMHGNPVSVGWPAPGSKTLTINLPVYRPFNGDSILLVYWTLE